MDIYSSFKLIHGKPDKRKERLREIMLECDEPAKVFHAAARWYGMRKKRETPSHSEFILYSSMIQLLAQEFSPEWIAREFPAVKEYKGHTWGAKDYFTSMETLREGIPFNGDESRVHDFLWEWDNPVIMGFVIAGLFLVDELRAEKGEVSLMREFADMHGIQTFHSCKVDRGRPILLDSNGRSIGRMQTHLKAVK